MTRNRFLLIGLSLLLCAACDDMQLEAPTLNVSIDTENATLTDENNIPVFKKGEAVKFNIDAKADMITFYSGEPGMMYKHRDRTSIEGSPFMQFDVQIDDSGEPGLLQVLLSSDFTGFTKAAETDGPNLTNAIWADITTDCNIPTGENATITSPKIDLNDYAGKPLYIAFRYTRPGNMKWRRYQIKNFTVCNEADGYSYPVMNTGNAGWTAFDFNASAGTDPYLATGGGNTNRIWDLRNAASDNRISIGYGSTTDFDDWAVTKPIDLTSVTPDLGEGIKAYDDDRLRDYQYIYTRTGIFTVSFVAFNSRFSDKESVVKEVTIKIID